MEKPIKPTKKQCDALWANVVKARAGFISEISGKAGLQIGGSEILHAHHLKGKSTYRLRYEVENGVCCTCGEHKYGFHVSGRRESYENKIFAKRRPDLFEYLDKLKWDVCKTDLRGVYLYLQEELKKYQQELSRA